MTMPIVQRRRVWILGALMTPSPVTIAPDASLRDAVELLAAMGVNSLPVMAGDSIVGLLSSDSIIAFESETAGVPTERDVSDVFEEDAPGDNDVPGSEYFTDLWDDTSLDVVERFRVSETPEWDVLSEHTVEEAMIADPPQLAIDTTVQSAAEFMQRTRAHRVLVVDGGRLCGIVTTMDITRAFATRDLPDRKSASD
jgi:CBS domain-containing protein